MVSDAPNNHYHNGPDGDTEADDTRADLVETAPNTFGFAMQAKLEEMDLIEFLTYDRIRGIGGG
jgi:hypothetical protein